MRRWIVVLVVALVATAQVPNKVEAQFQGKPTSYWAKQLQEKEVAKRIAAAKALEAIGPAAKTAVPELKNALKERAWELLIAQGGHNTNQIFKTVSGTIGSTSPVKEPSKDEVIAQLRRDLAQKEKDIANLRAEQDKQWEAIYRDPCLQALVGALMVIDRQALEAMVEGSPAKKTTKTFKSVDNTIGK